MNAPDTRLGNVVAQKARFDEPLRLRSGAELPASSQEVELVPMISMTSMRSRSGPGIISRKFAVSLR